MKLIRIEADGSTVTALSDRPSDVNAVADATAEMYKYETFAPPWCGYFAIEAGDTVGTCAFKGPPKRGRVEIAYFTFPAHEGRGVATRMARELLRIAHEALPEVVVTARTLREENASSAILRKLGFRLEGPAVEPDDQPVWEWALTPSKVRSRARS